MKKIVIFILSIAVFAFYGCGSDETITLPKGKNCQVLMNPLAFGQVKVGERVTKTAAIQCTQPDTLSVIIADLANSYFIPRSQTTVTITSPAGTANVDVIFAPTSFRQIIGAVQFKDSVGDTYDILLAGTGSSITSEANEIAPESEETAR